MQTLARLVQHSRYPTTGAEIATMELVYPRFIHSELMTHRVFSRNAASSRAIPIEKMIEQVSTDPAMPIHWGANKPGMQADNQVDDVGLARDLWIEAAVQATKSAKKLAAAGLHKQVVNRVLEPFQWMKTIVTSTDWDNFFELRCHPDAQPEIQDLALMMRTILNCSEPESVYLGDLHVPYVDRFTCTNGKIIYHTGGVTVTKEEALKISASCCAQVSYRRLDDSLDKAIAIYDRLIGSKPAHASPFEHQAEPARTIFRRSGNLLGWTQYRKILKL